MYLPNLRVLVYNRNLLTSYGDRLRLFLFQVALNPLNSEPDNIASRLVQHPTAKI